MDSDRKTLIGVGISALIVICIIGYAATRPVKPPAAKPATVLEDVTGTVTDAADIDYRSVPGTKCRQFEFLLADGRTFTITVFGREDRIRKGDSVELKLKGGTPTHIIGKDKKGVKFIIKL